MTSKRIVFTGGSGKAGQHAITYLLRRGYRVLNLDLVSSPNPEVHTIITDLTDSGQVFNGISSHFKLEQPFKEPMCQVPDAVIHFAGHARNMIVPDNETFRGNTLGTYNIIEAACKLGVKKIIIASSISVYGVTFAEGDIDFPSFPIDETLEVNPMDTYAISKVCGEKVAQGFARRFGVDIYALRIGAFVAPDEFQQVFAAYVNSPQDWKAHGWSYTDARDLGQMCERAILTDGLGFQIFNATNDEITGTMPTVEFLKQQCPNTPLTRSMDYYEAPLSNKKMKEILGFVEENHWRESYKSN